MCPDRGARPGRRVRVEDVDRVRDLEDELLHEAANRGRGFKAHRAASRRRIVERGVRRRGRRTVQRSEEEHDRERSVAGKLCIHSTADTVSADISSC